MLKADNSREKGALPLFYRNKNKNMDQSTGHYELIKKMETNNSINGLRCAHINVNGLYNKLDEIKLLLQEAKFDLLAITETHLNKNLHQDTEISIDGYSFLRKDRFGRRNHWGGVLIYYNNSLELHQLNFESDFEAIFVR